MKYIFTLNIKKIRKIILCNFNNENIQYIKKDNESDIDSLIRYFTMWVEYLYEDTSDIKYIGKLMFINPNYNFDKIIDESKINLSNFKKKYNIDNEKLYNFDKNEKQYDLFLPLDIRKYCKKILQKYNDTDDLESYKWHMMIKEFLNYHKINNELNKEYIEEKPNNFETEYILTDSIKYIKQSSKFQSNLEPELLDFDNYDYTNFDDIFIEEDDVKSEERKKLDRLELKCMFKNINKIPSPQIYIDSIYNNAKEQMKYLSDKIKTTDKEHKELIKRYQLAYITQYCRLFKFTYNNYVFIHENIEATDFNLYFRYHFVMNEYCKNENDIDDDNFFDETRFYVEFNFGKLFYHSYEYIHTSEGFIVTQLEMNYMENMIKAAFYSHVCKLINSPELNVLKNRISYGLTYRY